MDPHPLVPSTFSGITQDLVDPIWNERTQTQFSCVQGKRLAFSTVLSLSLAPSFIVLILISGNLNTERND